MEILRGIKNLKDQGHNDGAERIERALNEAVQKGEIPASLLTPKKDPAIREAEIINLANDLRRKLLKDLPDIDGLAIYQLEDLKITQEELNKLSAKDHQFVTTAFHSLIRAGVSTIGEAKNVIQEENWFKLLNMRNVGKLTGEFIFTFFSSEDTDNSTK